MRQSGAREDVLEHGWRNEAPTRFIACMPRRFRLTSEQESVWLPYDVHSNIADTTIRGFFGIARLAPSVARGSEQQLADAIADRLQEQTPLSRTWGLRLDRMKVADVEDTTRTALFVLLAAVGFVLLITCANTANLFLSQVAVRQREMAIRTAIGASRARLVREMLTESLLLAACGGAAGVLVAVWGVDAIVAAAPANLTFRATSPIEVDHPNSHGHGRDDDADGRVVGLLPALARLASTSGCDPEGASPRGGSVRSDRFAGGLIVVECVLADLLWVPR